LHHVVKNAKKPAFESSDIQKREHELLTIIKNTAALDYYPYHVLPQDVRALMERCSVVITTGSFAYLMKLFETFCHVTGASVTYIGLSEKNFHHVCAGFIGSFTSNCLIEGAHQTRRRYAVNFMKLLGEMQQHVPLCPTFTQDSLVFKNCAAVWEEHKLQLNPLAVRYWNGWTITDPKKTTVILALPQVWHSHGEEFAEQFYKQYRQNQEKKLRNDNAEVNEFLGYVAERALKYPPETFKCPVSINNLFNNYLQHSWLNSHNSGGDPEIKPKTYSKFINSINESFVDTGVWAKPFSGEFSKVPMTSKCGSRSKIVENADGREIKNNLITEIPLELTDSEAIDILFKKINLDNTLVFKWARSRCMKIRKTQLRRDRLATSGYEIKDRHPSAKSINDIGIENICASFKAHGLPFFRYDYQKRFGTMQKSEISSVLGLPKSIDFIAFQLLLIRSHQELTESFFKDFELYDKDGNLSGFLKTNSGYQFIGYKDRKGGELSEQKIDLSARDAAVVRMIIQLTEPLRTELKNIGDDSWRYLFLHCSQYVNRPCRAPLKKWGNHTPKNTMDVIVAEFAKHTTLSDADLRRVVRRVSATSYRPSVAVQNYLTHNSVTKLARSLGHSSYRANLLASYLPQVILDFFQTRWIRIFQKGIILEAMKDSPYLLKASGFDNMDTLHEFLSNHAFKQIPESMRSPKDHIDKSKKLQSKADKHKVVVIVHTPILTSLISLRDAVNSALNPDQISAKARYWAAFGALLAANIRDGFDDSLQERLAVAESRSNPESMMKFIYESAA
jgi:hypothetical protein